MKNRTSLLTAAVGLALLFTLLSCLAAALPRELQTTSAAVSAVQPVQEAAVGASKPLRYLLRTVADEVCLFQGDTLILHTGVTASLLPRQDREALAQGITAESQAELTALLEDLCS